VASNLVDNGGGLLLLDGGLRNGNMVLSVRCPAATASPS